MSDLIGWSLAKLLPIWEAIKSYKMNNVLHM